MIITIKLGKNEAEDFLKYEINGKTTQGTGVVYEVLSIEKRIGGGIVATCRICDEAEEAEYWKAFDDKF